jgi:DNA polymerase-3 subunit alpha
VADFIMCAKRNGIRVGPCRGSGGGSIVAYALGITDLDPIFHGLVFERFLNPERISMPDIDIDFDERRRGDVIRYVTEKYGDDRGRRSSPMAPSGQGRHDAPGCWPLWPRWRSDTKAFPPRGDGCDIPPRASSTPTTRRRREAGSCAPLSG